MKKWVIALSISVCIACGTNVSSGSQSSPAAVPLSSHPVDNPTAAVCILASQTDFKQRMIEILLVDLAERDIEVIVDDVTRGQNYAPDDYDAVILLSGVRAFHPLPDAVNYIRNNDYPENTVYFVGYTLTRFPYGLKLKRRKVDVVTSASKLDDEDVLRGAVDRVMSRVTEILDLRL